MTNITRFVGVLLLVLAALILFIGLSAVRTGEHESWGYLQPMAMFFLPGIATVLGWICVLGPKS